MEKEFAFENSILSRIIKLENKASQTDEKFMQTDKKFADLENQIQKLIAKNNLK